MALKWTSNFVRYSYMCNNVYLHVFVWFCMHIFIYFCGIYNLWVFFFTDFLPCHEVLTGSNMLFPPVTGHVFSASRWGSQAAMDVATMWGDRLGNRNFVICFGGSLPKLGWWPEMLGILFQIFQGIQMQWDDVRCACTCTGSCPCTWSTALRESRACTLLSLVTIHALTHWS